MRENKLLKASLLCYLVSLCTPIFIQNEFLGFQALIYGWVGFAGSDLVFGLPWLANLLYVLNLILSRVIQVKFQIILTIISILFALMATQVRILPGQREEMSIGFWFWITSFFILGIGQVWIVLKKKE